MDYHHSFCNKWSKIAEYLPGRCVSSEQEPLTRCTDTALRATSVMWWWPVLCVYRGTGTCLSQLNSTQNTHTQILNAGRATR